MILRTETIVQRMILTDKLLEELRLGKRGVSFSGSLRLVDFLFLFGYWVHIVVKFRLEIGDLYDDFIL